MEAPLTVRRLRADDPDLDRIAAQLNEGDSEVTAKTFSADSLRAFLSNPGHFYLVGLVDGAVAGAVHGYLHLHPAGARNLYVDEVDTLRQYRRRGIARALMQEAFTLARELGAIEVWLGTEDDNAAALALYRGLRPAEEEHGPTFTYRVT